MSDEQTVLLDLNNPVFQEALFSLPKAEKMAALDTISADHDAVYER